MRRVSPRTFEPPSKPWMHRKPRPASEWPSAISTTSPSSTRSMPAPTTRCTPLNVAGATESLWAARFPLRRPTVSLLFHSGQRNWVSVDRDSLRTPLDAASLRDGLVGPGMSWRRLDVVAETGSTNADLLARAEAGDDIDGSVLLAEYQNAGRGRHGRQWSAPPRTQVALSAGVSGGSVPRTGWGWLPLATGVAVADALAALGVEVGLKWPNDVLAGQGELGGTLAEVSSPRLPRRGR